MITATQPLIRPAYTDNGNRYNESNIGKFAAGTSVIGATTYYGGKYAFKGAQKVFNKAKTIKLNPPKIAKPSMESLKATAKKFSEKMPNTETIKTFLKNIPVYLAEGFKKIGKLVKQGFEFIAKNIKKINKTNVKKAGQAVVDFTKKPSVKYGAGVAAAFAGVLALGYAVDFVVNKINARKADKNA